MERAYEGNHMETIPVRRSHHDSWRSDMQRFSIVAGVGRCEGGEAIPNRTESSYAGRLPFLPDMLRIHHPTRPHI